MSKQIQTGHINFMAQRKIAMGFSLLLLVLSVVTLAVNGLKMGLDFTGGTVIELAFDPAPELEAVRKRLEEGGYTDVTVQTFGSTRDILIRLAPVEGKTTADLSNEVIDHLRAGFEGSIEIRRVEFVGPQVGKELAEDGGLAMLFALLSILVYVSIRFEKRFAMGAVAALVHDVMLILGLFSITGVEFDLTVLAALLAIIGYSLNDTIVVFDRIRENFRKLRKVGPVDTVNISINETLSRTIMTSLTTLLVVGALFVVGGETIHNFAEALLVGILVGTYSSIYIASALALFLGISREDLLPPEKEEEAEEVIP